MVIDVPDDVARKYGLPGKSKFPEYMRSPKE
jgi:hypothetical protein